MTAVRTDPGHHTFADRLRYRFDRAFATGPVALILWLAVATFAMILLAATVLAVLHASINGRAEGFPEAFWASLLRTLDPGTMGSDQGWEFRLVSLLVTLGGIFIVSTLIGLIATALDRRLERLRQGRSRIIEQGHTLILGQSSKLLTILEEVVAANASQRSACIVVLAPGDKTALDGEIRHRIGDPKHTRIICRTGDGSDPLDLDLVNPLQARSIVILAPDDETDDGFVIRAVLALMARRPGLVDLDVVAEMKTISAARTLREVTQGRVTTVVSDEIIGRIAAQVCRRHGLSRVYLNLLDFAGSEIYFTPVESIDGTTFGEAAFAFEQSSPIGIRTRDGTTVLAPAPDTPIGDGDDLIVVTEDDSAIVHAGAPAGYATRVAGGAPPSTSSGPERFLVFGWSSLGPIIIRELDQYVEPGSELVIIGDPAHWLLPDPDDSVLSGLEHMTVRTASVGHHDTAEIERWIRTVRPDHILLLCNRDALLPAQADAAVLMSLLQIRHILAKEDLASVQPGIVAELLDHRDVDLARVSGADDFLVSDRLTSLLMAQLSENPRLDPVFQDLLDVRGAELDLRPITWLPAMAPPTFADLVRLGQATGDVVIGYRIRNEDTDRDGSSEGSSLVMNPPKFQQAPVRVGDELVVLTQGRG